MKSKRKISIRKVIQTLVTLVLLTGSAFAMIGTDKLHRNKKLTDVRLRLESPAGVRFLTLEDVRNMLFTSRHIQPLSLKVDALNERAMESILAANPWVKNAQVFTGANGIMHIILTQRVPIVRIFEEDGNSYYLDDSLQAMPLSNKYTHYTPVVTGVPHLLNDNAAMIAKGKIVGLIRFLNRHPFWNAQVSQVNMQVDGGFEFIPIVGNQKIILGDTDGIEEKLHNLMSFYNQIQNKIGWDKYTTIDLRFSGQVVASPSLPWKRPADAALTNMSWLKAIMEHAPTNANQANGDPSGLPDSAQKISSPAVALQRHISSQNQSAGNKINKPHAATKR